MSNRYYRSQFNFSNAAKTVSLRAKVSIGALGAPTLVSGTGMGIASISRVSAGEYDIVLDRAFSKLMAMQVMPVSASLPAAPVASVKLDDVANPASPKITVQLTDLAGVAADPASGEAMLIEIVLNDSALAY